MGAGSAAVMRPARFVWETLMAAARDQAARVLHDGSEQAEGSSGLGQQLRTHVAEEGKRRPAETPSAPPGGQPAAPTQGAAAAAPSAPKPRKRKFVLIGFLALLVIAAASYATYYLVLARLYVSTDDAYVRANNSMLGARVAGHIAAILPDDNTLVRK